MLINLCKFLNNLNMSVRNYNKGKNKNENIVFHCTISSSEDKFIMIIILYYTLLVK